MAVEALVSYDLLGPGDDQASYETQGVASQTARHVVRFFGASRAGPAIDGDAARHGIRPGYEAKASMALGFLREGVRPGEPPRVYPAVRGTRHVRRNYATRCAKKPWANGTMSFPLSKRRLR